MKVVNHIALILVGAFLHGLFDSLRLQPHRPLSTSPSADILTQAGSSERKTPANISTFGYFARSDVKGNNAIGSEVETNTNCKCADDLKPPTNIGEARTRLLAALKWTWDLKEDDKLFADPPGRSTQRMMLDRFVHELASQLGGNETGPVCMDWDERYSRRFAGCKTFVNFKYDENEAAFSRPVGRRSGLIRGDISGNLSTDIPDGIVNFMIFTQVIEHIPHFWNSLPNLARLVDFGGTLLFSAPFAYRFHAVPGEFYRFSPMAIIYLLESSGSSVCHIVSDGWRTLQSHLLGFGSDDISMEYIAAQPLSSLLKGANNYQVLAQRVVNIGDPCQLLNKNMEFTNEITRVEVERMSNGWFPSPTQNFPFTRN